MNSSQLSNSSQGDSRAEGLIHQVPSTEITDPKLHTDPLLPAATTDPLQSVSRFIATENDSPELFTEPHPFSSASIDKTYLSMWPGLVRDGIAVDTMKDEADLLQSGLMLPSTENLHKKWATLRKDEGRAVFHVAITSCDNRHEWSRSLASTLLSIWTSDVEPLTATIIWCRPANRSTTLPASLLYNLRYSQNVHVQYLPRAVADGTMPLITAQYWLALNVPFFYGLPEVPLLVVEDDVLFHPDFSAHIHKVIAHAEVLTRLTFEDDAQSRTLMMQSSPSPPRQNGGLPIKQLMVLPFIINLYRGSNIVSLDQAMQAYRAKHEDEEKDVTILLAGAVDTVVAFQDFGWGTQALLYSPAVVAGLRAHFSEILHGDRKTIGLQDMLLKDFLWRYKINGVLTFASRPCLVQHVGSRSAIFGANSSRFHTAEDFPFKVAFPAEDPSGSWRKTMS
ncbi:hypothetical protein CEUSTIGMA_g11733.t1 [Chlamydomonas eustigma]|uniref:Uncharacterized protein n=1 Tax=Chlamydomonas eustigma TaxID=1157962 RepID=A0A250XMH6_9CHLO|nr:hypothetical protein CEUSTIGMA_g11733.t1 [Chlamydomonas eustigma]|eukprot:GAX84311.1 hypothetical protein CEUSTIGMA_g11733.t1 [Chlamydomonas eustigma]